MLIDWVTARVPLDLLTEQGRAAALAINDRVMRLDPNTGEIRWQTAAWDSVRSDSHQIAVRCLSELWVQGSPARVIADGCSVFGADPASSLDLAGCVDVMRRFVSIRLGVVLPPALQWIVSRVDVTGNLLLDSPEEVRQALSILRDCEGGRYRVSQQAGDTVYWSHRSKLRSGKAYAKGPHLRYLQRQRSYTGRSYTDSDIAEASRLLRLELKLGREYFQRHDWKTLDAKALAREWEGYFSRMIGDTEMTRDNELKDAIDRVAASKGRANSAYGCWLMIQSEGWERARECFSKTSWYRHMQVLRAAGLGDADISSGRVVPLRRKVMEARLVRSWSELRAA